MLDKNACRLTECVFRDRMNVFVCRTRFPDAEKVFEAKGAEDICADASPRPLPCLERGAVFVCERLNGEGGVYNHYGEQSGGHRGCGRRL